MTKARLDGLQLLLLGSVFFVAIGAVMEFTNPLGMTDFQQIYRSSRCVAQHHDPYQPDELMACYQADTGTLPSDSDVVSRTLRKIVFIAPNLPTTLFLIAPVAALPWKFAVPVWMILIAGCFILACFRVWNAGAESAPRLYGALIFLILVNSGLLLATGNTAGLVVSLSILAVSCFLQDRDVLLGVFCLAVALAIKPHDAGPIWLYFLLAGGVHRKRALQTAALTLAIVVPAVLWVSHAAPHWLPELQSNLAVGLSKGGLNNPGPTTQGGRGIGMIISLQAALSLAWDNAGFYNLASYLICGALLLVWCVKTLRSRFSPRLAWFALAAVSALTMLPFYHRTYDARLLVLAVPACAALWTESHAPARSMARSALFLTVAAVVLTGDIFWVVFFQLTHYSGASVTWGMIPAPVTLLALAVFYLWIYVRSPSQADAS
ncbi:MAG: glycosyltransferase family 87 protein [Terracidiphilus sp.]